MSDWNAIAQLRAPGSVGLFIDEIADYGIFMLDATGHVLTWNKGAERLHDYRAEEILGAHFSRLYPDEDRAAGRCERELDVALRDGRFEEEGWRVRKDETRFWANVVITAIRDARGERQGFAHLTRDLTERRQAQVHAHELATEQAARSSAEAGRSRSEAAFSEAAQAHAQLKAVFQAMTDGVIVLDIRGNVALINEAGARIYGYPNAESMQHDLSYFHEVFELATLDGRILPLEEWPGSQVLKGKTLSDWELWGRRRDTGQEWYFAYSGIPVKDEHGNLVRALLITRDITDRKRAEAALRESEERFRGTFDNAAVGIAHLGLDGRWLALNDRLCAITGYSREELLVTNLQSVTHPEDLGKDLALTQQVVDGRLKTYSVQKRFLRRSGGELWINLTVSAQRGADGRVRSLIAIIEDVSARKEAESRLREAEQQFRTLADSIPQLAWIAEADGSIHWYNQRWYEYTGTTPAEMEDESGWGWKKVHDPLHLARVLARFQEAVASGRPWEDTFPLRRKDGELRWHLSRAMPIRDGTGRVMRWFGTNTDVEDQRRQAAQLREAVQARDTFLSIASHELKTPLTALALRLQTLDRAARHQPESPFVHQVRAGTAMGLRQVEKLSTLINDLLDVSRIAAGRLRLELEPTDVGALLREVVERLEPEAAKAGVSVRVTAPETLLMPTAKLRFDQVVTNLLDNAIKYGAGKPVEVELVASANDAVLTIADHGIGIAPENLSRIFERFERAVSERNYGGLGLGLYITRTIVEALGGTIRVESQMGVGARFTVALPMRMSQAPAVLSSAEVS